MCLEEINADFEIMCVMPKMRHSPGCSEHVNFFSRHNKRSRETSSTCLFLGTRGEFGHILWSCQPNFHRNLSKVSLDNIQRDLVGCWCVLKANHKNQNDLNFNKVFKNILTPTNSDPFLFRFAGQSGTIQMSHWRHRVTGR